MIQIIADTTCGIPVEKLKAQGIHVLPQIIILGRQPITMTTSSIRKLLWKSS